MLQFFGKTFHIAKTDSEDILNQSVYMLDFSHALCHVVAWLLSQLGQSVLKSRSRCVTELISLTESTLWIFIAVQSAPSIFHVYFLRESAHKMTSVHQELTCSSVTPKQRHVLQMDRLWMSFFDANWHFRDTKQRAC